MQKKLLFLLLFMLHIQAKDNKITRSYINYGINVGQSMNNAGSSYYPNNIVTKVFFQGNVKQCDLKQDVTSGNAMYTINLPGRYYIASDLNFTPSNNSVIGIKVATSNVILDLNSKTLNHISNGQTSFNLIQIEPGISNITITNGKLVSDSEILTTGGTGIFLNKNSIQGANNIELSNLSISKFSNGAILEENTQSKVSNGLTVSNISISEINGNSTTTSSALALTNRTNITIQNSTFNNNNQSLSSGTIKTIYLNGCSNIKLSNCDVSYNTGNTSLYAYDFEGCRNIELSYCSSSTNSSLTDIRGYFFIADYDVKVNNCETKNLWGNSIAYGFYILNGSIATGRITFSNCIVAGLNSNGFINGYIFNGTSNNGASFYQCQALNNSASGESIGFLNNGSNCYYKDCISQNNISINGSSYGFESSGNKIRNRFEDCLAISNISTAFSQTGAGFYFIAEVNTTITNCESYNNGCTFSAANGGLGAGIIFDAQSGGCVNCIVSNNKLYNNFGSSTLGSGRQYGFVDWTNPTKTILMKNISIGHGEVFDAISADGKTIVNSSGSTPYQHNYLLSFQFEQISASIKETASENMDALSTTDKYHNISVYRRTA